MLLLTLWRDDLAGQPYADITRLYTYHRACGTVGIDGIFFWPASKRHSKYACIRSVSPQSIPVFINKLKSLKITDPVTIWIKKKRWWKILFKKKNIVTLIKLSKIEMHESTLSLQNFKKNFWGRWFFLKGSNSLQPYTQKWPKHRVTCSWVVSNQFARWRHWTKISCQS